MPKMDFGINGMDQEAAAGRESWGGPIPPTGTYNGRLKICQVAETSIRAKNPGKPMLKIGVELITKDDFNGYVAFRNLVLIDSTVVFVNQFLRALTDGSDAEFEKIKKAFYQGGPIVDERQKNILRIGTWKINSPDGELPVKVALKQRTYTPEGGTPQTSAGIESFLFLETGGGTSSSSDDEPVSEENTAAEVDLGDVADESVFDDDDEPVNA